MSDKPIQIFVSYARKDNNLPRGTDGQGFVTALEEQLNYEFEQYGDPSPQVWWDRDQIEDGDSFPIALEQAINGADLFLIVLSRNWLSRPFCQQEFALFQKRWANEGEFGVEHRIKIVHKSFVEESDRPPLLQRQSGYAFYSFDGRKREETRERPFFDRGKPLGGEYTEKVRDLGGHLWRAARNIRKKLGPDVNNPPTLIQLRPPAPRRGRTVYLAKPAPDMQSAYQRVARELNESGYDVVPDVTTDLSLDAASIDAALAKAEVSIHLLGAAPTEAAAATNGVALQLALAATKVGPKPEKDGPLGFRRLIWAPKVLENIPPPADGALRDPVAVVEGGVPSLWNDKIFGDNSTNFIVFVQQNLEDNPPTRSLTTELDKIQGGSQVYLYHRDVDRRYAVNVAKALRARNVNTWLSAVSGEQAARDSLHRQRLLECDSVVLCWASAPEVWAMTSAHELKSWQELGRARQFACRGVVVGPPPDDLKADFVDLFPPNEIDVALDLTRFETIPSDQLDRLITGNRPADR